METPKKKKVKSKGYEIEISLEDLSLLKILLNIETAVSIKYFVGLKEENVDLRTQKVIAIFENFRNFDEGLLYLEQFLLYSKKMDEKAMGESMNLKNIVLMSKHMLNICKILLTDTVKLPLPEALKSKIDKNVPVLLNKVEMALNKTSKPTPKENPPETLKEESPGDEKVIINMFGKRGFA